MSKRILSILMVMVMVFAVATTACGKKEDAAAKEEPKVETEEPAEEDQQVEENEDDSDPVEDEVVCELKKTDVDLLTEEDIQSLKNSIRDAVILEYIEPKKISAEEFVWPEDDGTWLYLDNIFTDYSLAHSVGEESDIAKLDSDGCADPELIRAVFSGITKWLDKQGEFTLGYIGNVSAALSPFAEVIPTIDITSK